MEDKTIEFIPDEELLDDLNEWLDMADIKMSKIIEQVDIAGAKLRRKMKAKGMVKVNGEYVKETDPKAKAMIKKRKKDYKSNKAQAKKAAAKYAKSAAGKKAAKIRAKVQAKLG